MHVGDFVNTFALLLYVCTLYYCGLMILIACALDFNPFYAITRASIWFVYKCVGENSTIISTLLSLVTCFVLGLLRMFYCGFICAIWDINQFKFIFNCQTIPLYLSNEDNLCSPAQVRRLVSHIH